MVQLSSIFINAGHFHESFGVRTVCNPDGTWTVVNVQASSGGADEAPTVNNWSDPDGVPQKGIVYRVAIRNKSYGSITGMIDITISPECELQKIKRTDIGAPDGAPFVYDRFINTHPAEKHRSNN